MSDGYKAVQSTHAAINFVFEHPSRAGPWFYDSNYLVELEIEDEHHLKKLIRDCEKHTLVHTVFREPDIGNEITAIAIEPSPITQKLVKKLSPLFKKKINHENKHNNTGNQSQNGKPYPENTLQEKHSECTRRRENKSVQPNLWSKLTTALGIKRLQRQEKGQGRTLEEKASLSSDKVHEEEIRANS